MKKELEKSSLSAVLPIYNEEEQVAGILEKAAAYLETITADFEIICVNDGSFDRSPEIIAEFSAKQPRISLINSPKNTGYGWALRKGIAAAEKDWILLFDADGQFDITELGRLWEAKDGQDFILGWRKKRNDDLYRRILGASGNCLANIFLKSRPPVVDINCGFKLFRSKLIKPLPLFSTGGTINFEILYSLKGRSCGFVQLPVSHYPRRSGRPTGGKFSSVIVILKEALKIIFRHAPDQS